MTRRNFLKLGGAFLGGIAFNPDFVRENEYGHGEIARVTIGELDLYTEPRDDSVIIGKRYRDQLVHIYYQLTSPYGPAYNPVWYRVWGGYLHSAYLQKVKVQYNQTLSTVPASGQLCEVTVPYSQPYQHSLYDGWQPFGVPLYYETTQWVTAIEEGPDGEPWYQLTSEIYKGLTYLVPTAHLRPISDEEISPISPGVPPEHKRIEVSIFKQSFTAFENDEIVYTCRISSGIPGGTKSPNGIPTATPTGRFRIFSKLPSKHMGSVSGNPDAAGASGYSLPGVPWTSFFVDTGVAFHGTYWHNNFGVQMSHGCINMRNDDAKWLFRWCMPEFKTPIESFSDWEKRGRGTNVFVN